MMLRADGWTVEVYQRQATPDAAVEQRVRLKHLGFVVYDGTDLVRARLLLEDGGVDWADLEPIDGGGETAAAS